MADIITYNGSWLGYNGSVITTRPDPNPIGLPAYTMRFQFANASYDPTSKTGWPSGSSWSQVSSSPNVWDFTYQNANWNSAFSRYESVGNYYGQFTSRTSGDTVVLGANTSNVTVMIDMFRECSSLVSLAYFDTSNVRTMEGLFRGCSSLSVPPYFDTSRVTDMSAMFHGSTALIDVPAYDTHNVTTMADMFEGCVNLAAYNQDPALRHPLPLFDTHNVTNMTNMFRGCTRLSEVPAYDTHNVTGMAGIFYQCKNLPRIPTFNTSRVAHMSSAFYQVGISLSADPLISQYPYFVLPLLDTSSVINMDNMCYQAKMLSIPLLDTSSVVRMNGAFEECTYVESGALALYQQASSQATVPSNHSRTFRHCGSGNPAGSAELAEIPSGWK